jgi:hypothetical protein
VRTLQIIVGALVAGCLVFMVIAIVVGPQIAPPAPGQGLEILTAVAIGFTAMQLAARAIVPAIMVRRGKQAILRGESPVKWRFPEQDARMADFYEKTGDAGKLMMLYRAKTIAGAAMLEGAAFFGLITYLANQGPIALALGGLLIVGVALHFPTRSGVIRWIGDQLLWLEQRGASSAECG